MPREHRLRLILAFAAVYIIWGSTYLGIRLAVATMPPFLMAAARFLVAGAILYVWGLLRGARAPVAVEWRTAAVIGLVLLLGGNGLVVWAEQRVTSSLAALIVAAEPLWVVLIDWARPGGKRPSLGVSVGLVIGFAGVVLLINPAHAVHGTAVTAGGALVLTLACIFWASGSIYSRHAPAPPSPLMATGSNMLAGSACFLVAALATGEFSRLDVAAITARSWIALAYLTVFGAVIGFTAYLWLLKNTTLARASTYAFVNPVIAVFLGWLIAGEPLSPRTLVAAAIIIGGVVTISTFQYAKAGALRLFTRGGAAALPSSVPGKPEDG